MSKYAPLWNHIQASNSNFLELTFEEIKTILGFEIDHSFLTYKKELTQFGFQMDKISLKRKNITFIKI